MTMNERIVIVIVKVIVAFVRLRTKGGNPTGTVLGRQFKWGVFLQKSNGGVY